MVRAINLELDILFTAVVQEVVAKAIFAGNPDVFELPPIPLSESFPLFLLREGVLVEGCEEDVDWLALASWLVNYLTEGDLGWTIKP